MKLNFKFAQMWKLISVFCLAFIFSFNLLGQNASLLINEFKEQPLFVWINGVELHLNDASAVVVNNIPTPVCQIKIKSGLSGPSFEQSLFVSPDLAYHYTLKTVEGKSKLIYQSETEVNRAIDQEFKTFKGMESPKIISFGEKQKPTEGLQTLAGTPNKSTGSLQTVADESTSIAKWVKGKQCDDYMSEDSFEELCTKVLEKDFEEEKMQIVKNKLSQQCLKVDQFKELIVLFDFERTKLDIAQFAYHYLDALRSEEVLAPIFEFDDTTKDWVDYVRKLNK